VEGWVDEQGERYAGAGLADASMAVTEKDWSRRFDCAILDMVVSTYVPKFKNYMICNTHSTNNRPTTPTSPHHISSAITNLASPYGIPSVL
jgi:hypothetical protein